MKQKHPTTMQEPDRAGTGPQKPEQKVRQQLNLFRRDELQLSTKTKLYNQPRKQWMGRISAGCTLEGMMKFDEPLC